MSDTNALLSRNSVLDRIANPQVVNPLAAMSDAAKTAQAIYGVRQAKAQQAVGQIATESIDPVTKQFDQARFNAAIANAGPDVAAYAQPGLQNASTLADTQTRQQLLKVGWYNGATGALPDNASYDQVVNTIRSGASVGMTPTEIANSIAQVPRDPAQLQAYIQQHRLTAGNTVTQLEQQYGTRQAVTDESGTQFVTVPRAGANQPNVVVPAGMGPRAAGAQVQWTDSSGVVHYGTQAQYQQARGVDPRIGPQTPVLAPPPTAPQQPGSNAPPPPPANTTIRSPGAYVPPTANAPVSTGSSAGGKVPPTAPGPQSQNVPPAGAISSDVAAIQGGMQTARNTPSGTVPGVVAAAGPAAGTSAAAPVYTDTTGPPAGFGEKLNNDIKAHTDASLAASDQRKNLQAGENAFEALKLAGNYTGAGTGTAAALYSWLQARAPQWAIPQGTMTDTAWRQVLAKNLLRFAQESGMRMNTDLGLNEALKGTANADTILPNANREILINDIGMARQRLAQTQLMPSPSGDGAVVNHFRTYTSDTDPRAFAWDLYSAAERKAIEAEVAKDKSGKAEKRLNKGLEDAARVGLIKLPGQSQAAPPPSSGPAATPGPVATTPANALLAASSGGPPNALAA